MKTDTSAKKIILLLVGLNITTILISMMACPLQNTVNAAPNHAALLAVSTPASGCAVKERDLSKSTFPTENPTYSGTLTTNTGTSIATFDIQFTGDPGKLTNVE